LNDLGSAAGNEMQEVQKQLRRRFAEDRGIQAVFYFIVAGAIAVVVTSEDVDPYVKSFVTAVGVTICIIQGLAVAYIRHSRRIEEANLRHMIVQMPKEVMGPIRGDCDFCQNPLDESDNTAQIVKCEHVFHRGCYDSFVEGQKRTHRSTQGDIEDGPLYSYGVVFKCPVCGEAFSEIFTLYCSD